ncbi:MAG: hypothetical protein IJS15_08125 [Victivallales bacterium]|nr:hypothetical protein [Victivallales bacterium]
MAHCYVKSKPSAPGSNCHDRQEEFSEKFAEANANKLPCLACDTLDNDWPERRGLCLDCYCAVIHSIPLPADGSSRADLFMRMTRRDIVTIALYYHKEERERRRLQELKGKLNINVPRQAGYREVQRIIEKLQK